MDRVTFFPVRHHSPACARALQELALYLRPEIVLIEGPSDFNERIEELYLPHQLPIAIYSYVRMDDGRRRGAYYPFCLYSPEWQALLTARNLKVPVRFIDLPWSEICRIKTDELLVHRYADAQLRRSAYIQALCNELGVDDFDALWDELFEIDFLSDFQTYLTRSRHFCNHSRMLSSVDEVDSRREAFMVQSIRKAVHEFSGAILVVTGGYHTCALEQSLEESRPDVADIQINTRNADGGIALTPYSYERLDSLTGYEAGMPGPGFYNFVWESRVKDKKFDYRRVLSKVIEALRRKKQIASTADFIAAETSAQALAALRGHSEVWRRDLLDGLRGALIKDELARGGTHPLLDVASEVFRGHARGKLAEGTILPPLVHDLHSLLDQHELGLETQERKIKLVLSKISDREKSRVLHCLRLLGISGFALLDGTDMKNRTDLGLVWEEWSVKWTPDYDATSIEAARYGPTLAEAAAAVLAERAQQMERDVEKAAELLVDAALAGLGKETEHLCRALEHLVKSSCDFPAMTKSLDHLLYLYQYDTVLEMERRENLSELIKETYRRSLWLLESLGKLTGKDHELIHAIRILLEAFEHCGEKLSLSKEEITAVFQRIEADQSHLPIVRGAAIGTLWALKAADGTRLLDDMKFFRDPQHLGDFLTGLFALAREAVQREPQLLVTLDSFVNDYQDEEFLEALPGLRLAFTFFTPREKHYLAMNLLSTTDVKKQEPVQPQRLDVSPEEVESAIALEGRIAEIIKRYGIRGGKYVIEKATLEVDPGRGQ